MPHDAIDETTNVSLPYYIRVNGAPIVATRYQIGICGKFTRPKSVKNPKIKGFRAPSNWSATSCRWAVSDGLITWQKPGQVRTMSGCIGGFSSTNAIQIADLDPNLANDALRKALSGLLENDVAFNAFMLQGKQSLSMAANLAAGIAHGTDKLMTARFKTPKQFRNFLKKAGDKAVSNFSGKYLEFLYGWKPLADDVENAFQYMLDGYTGPEQKRFRLVVRKTRKLKQQLLQEQFAASYWTANWGYRFYLTKVNMARTILNYQFPSQVGEMLPTLTPFGTAWELMPWSFVVDWFIPIGDWIGAMEASQYSIYMDKAILTQSVKVASQQDARSSWSSQAGIPGYVFGSSYPPVHSGYSFKMTRQVLSPSAVLDRIRFPDFASKFGLPQASQALALLSQVFNKWS